MAARKSFLYFGGADRISPMIPSDGQFEFDEAEVWNSNEVATSDHRGKKSMHNSHPSKKPLKKSSCSVSERPSMNAATSLPVNIPDWSRILGDEYKNNRRESEDNDYNDDDDENEYGRLPPHEYLARTRGSSFSVHEGIGRTLKGRDLSRVRNAVWKQIGFED